MKVLYIVRHSKASPKHLPIEDFYRPLYDKGIIDPIKMGKNLKNNNCIPQVIISSTASRAIATARAIATQMEYQLGMIIPQEDFYDANAKHILQYTKNLNDAYESAMIVGHNPSLTELVHILNSEFRFDIDTCGVVGLRFNCNSWNEISATNSTLLFYKIP